jgi:hypothetical protein
MNRYFFHTRDRRDDVGVQLATLEAAKCEAIKHAGCLVCETADSFWDRADWFVTVTDSAQKTLFEIKITATEAT